MSVQPTIYVVRYRNGQTLGVFTESSLAVGLAVERMKLHGHNAFQGAKALKPYSAMMRELCAVQPDLTCAIDIERWYIQ